MRKAGKKITAALLVLAMVLTSFLGYMPVNEVKAADSARKWITITGGANNGGGHAYGDAATKAPIFLMDKDKTAKVGDELSLALKPSTNWGVFYLYKDDNNWIYIGHDPSSNWYYQYKINGQTSYPGISGLPDPVEGEEMQMSISLSRETLTVTVNGVAQSVTDQALIDMDGIEGYFGVKTNLQTTISFADVIHNNENCMDDTWGFCAEREGQIREDTEEKMVGLSGTVTDATTNKPIEGATVRVGANSATTDAQGQYHFDALAITTYTMSVTKAGYDSYTQEITIEDKDNKADVKLSQKAPLDLNQYDTIASSAMKVYIGKNFPVVARYQMLEGGKETEGLYFRGNETEMNSVAINGTSIVPTVTVSETTDSSRTYDLQVKDTAGSIDLDMSVKVSVEDNTLVWEVTKIQKAEGCAKIATIDFPQLNLVTVDAAEEGANFAGAQLTTATTTSGDTYISFADGFIPSNTDGYVYAFLQNGKLSAGVQSNSEAEKDKRVIRNNGADTMSLTSAPWYYELGDKNGQAKAGSYDPYPISELPCAKVVIAGDVNEDGDIDWNDGALAARDIVQEIYGADAVKDLVNYRIVMNFASMAPNPFLTTADNIKKVYLATDGLPQAVMLKGYGNEGHDSANSEYADIAEREGGAEDFQSLLKVAHDYNTEVGIHINAQEIYPEAASMNESMVQKPVANGWGWLDQSVAIDKYWDLASQARWKRLVQLYDRINNTSHYSKAWPDAVKESEGTVDVSKEELQEEADSLKDNMDFIYLDVWYQDTWETRQIAKEINSLGWRFSTEFPYESEYNMTWYHWGTDTNYGGASTKGHNSEIMRFLWNDKRDTHVLNWPAFGGTADNPLLGGFKLYGFEGWQGNQNYNSYIRQTFDENLPTKFLQHYYIVDWEDYGEGETAPTGNKEKQITLKNDDGDTVIVKRNEEQRSDITIERTITLNGKVVLNDAAYLLPWTDNQDGTEKLYYWNLDEADPESESDAAPETTWELQDDWKNLENVVVYELSDQGRINEQTVPVTDGTITLSGKAATPYVVVKGAAKKELKNDFGEYDYVVDPGFNGYAAGDKLDRADWKGDIKDVSVVVEKAVTGDQRLAFNEPDNDVEVTTTISGLKKGTDYVAEVYVENNSDAKASISVNTGSKTVSNYTERSVAYNYVQADGKHVNMNLGYESRMQRMQVSFTAEAETAELTLSREEGEGTTYMDDIRIVKKSLDNFQEDGSFKQDFETVVQGLYPFVLSSAQGVSDPVTHLSQKHEPFTQTGWNGRVLDDVLDGNWSLKHHGANTGIIYQTIPQNFRFEPGKVYTVEFDYQCGPDNTYAMVIGDGTSYDTPSSYFAQARGTTQHATMQVIGSGSGQTWIGLYERGSSAGSGAWGQVDFILDNLVITEDPEAVAVTIAQTDLYKGEAAGVYGSGLEQITWTNTDDSVAVLDEETMQVKALSAGTTTLTATLPDGTTQEFVITVSDSVVSELTSEDVGGMEASANTEETASESAGAVNATDGNPGTFWHTGYSTGQFAVSETNPAVLTVELGEESSIGGFTFQQRPSGQNGFVQKFNYRILDAEGNVLKSAEAVEVPAASQSGGAWMTVQLDEMVNAKTIEISVTQGSNGFAAIAEVAAIITQKVAENVTLKDVEVEVGEKAAIEVTLEPGTIAKGLVWSSSDETIAKVSNQGVVNGLKAGTVTIKVTNAAGLEASCKVTVKAAEVVVLPYKDVQEGDWFYTYVYDAYVKGFMTGLKKDIFGPTDNLVRAQFATILWRMEGEPVVDHAIKFPDVAEGQFFTEAVRWAAANGIITGYTNTGMFGTNDNITREQMATMMYRYANAKNYKLSVPKDSDAVLASYPDAKLVSSFAKEAMAWCVQEGIITGDQGKLNPQGSTNRAVCATIISRFATIFE